jgi:SAM-dependent methyltransferase
VLQQTGRKDARSAAHFLPNGYLVVFSGELVDQRWKNHRAAFDTVADLYDEVRPSYPRQLVLDVLAPFERPSDIRVLEVGCGTGQATKLFAEHGREIVAVEPGASLIGIAQAHLHDNPKVSFNNCNFEDYSLISGSFDLVISATAIFWVPSEVRYQKTADALKPDGFLATFFNGEKPANDEVRKALRSVHAKVFDYNHPLYPKDQKTNDPHFFGTDIAKSGFFTKLNTIEYPAWIETFSKEKYIKLLQTKAGYIVLTDDEKRCLYQGISEVIDELGGEIEMSCDAVLYLAQKLP